MIVFALAAWLAVAAWVLGQLSAMGRGWTEALAVAVVAALWPAVWVTMVVIGPMARMRARCRSVGR